MCFIISRSVFTVESDFSLFVPTQKEFPSGFIYINGVFYSDMRNPNAKDYSEVIKKWAEKRKEIGTVFVPM